MALSLKTKAPDFTLFNSKNEKFTLSVDFKNQPCIIFFYPKDFSGVCTAEVCSFKNEFSDFRNLNINIIGINKDAISTHREFIEYYQLPFELLSDTSGDVCEAYDAIVPLVRMVKRVIYLLDHDHKIVAVYNNLLARKQEIADAVVEMKQKAQDKIKILHKTRV